MPETFAHSLNAFCYSLSSSGCSFPLFLDYRQMDASTVGLLTKSLSVTMTLRSDRVFIGYSTLKITPDFVDLYPTFNIIVFVTTTCL